MDSRLFKCVILFSVALCALGCNEARITGDSTTEDYSAPDYNNLVYDAESVLTSTEQIQLAKINTFAFNLAKNNDFADDGYVFSPVSVAYLLGMLSEGAAGETRAEILNALGYDAAGQQQLNAFCSDLMNYCVHSESDKDVLEIADLAVIDNAFAIKENYRNSIKESYGAEIASKSFSAENIPAYINDWVHQKTHSRISHILDTVDPSSFAIFLNALYFKGFWKAPFAEAATRDALFGDRMVSMMSATDAFAYCKSSTYSTLTVPYSKFFEMALILPDEGVSTKQVLSSLDGVKWAEMYSRLKSSRVNLWLPKFEINTAFDMKESLQTVGIRHLFGEHADFSLMSDSKFEISGIKHIANISVNEGGTEAAAVSYTYRDTGNTGDGSVIDFHCDRPFLFAVVEKTTGSILFLGCCK
ncbi:MAG: hypothetical protein IJU68_00920 [Bacteroidales bacterium]|nr:hypothetical protein [Bacteroidales bacterium]